MRLSLRKYPGAYQPSSFEVIIDCQRQQATALDAAPIALSELEVALDELVERGR